LLGLQGMTRVQLFLACLFLVGLVCLLIGLLVCNCLLHMFFIIVKILFFVHYIKFYCNFMHVIVGAAGDDKGLTVFCLLVGLVAFGL
jgi:hypothetical protein